MNNKKEKKYYIFELDIAKLNLLCVILFILVCGLTFCLYKGNILVEIYEVNLVLLLAFYIIFMLLHELLHSLAYKLYGGSSKKIVFGSYLEKGVLYCLCKQNITRKNILNSLMFPLFYLGLIPYIISIILNLPFLLLLSILNIVGSVGDIVMFIYISKLNKNIEFSEFDNPIRFAIYADYDVSQTKHFGLEFIEETDTIERNDLNKITISKGSYIAIAILIICVILSLFL